MAWRDVLICTVGTSLKKNLQSLAQAEWDAFERSGNPKPLALRLLQQDAASYVCGAEVNSISSISKRGHLHGRRKLLLLVSDTQDGSGLGGVLAHYYQHRDNPARFQEVAIERLAGLTDSDPERFRTEGLRNLVRAIAAEVRRESAETIVINATGGYKAQISFAGMIGQALGIPVCYLFERFSEVIELPPQPISLDLSFWLANVDTFYALAADEAEENPCDKESRFESLVDEISTGGDSLIGLSAVGELFHETFCHAFLLQRQLLLPPDCVLESVKKVTKYEDDNKGKHAGLSTYLERLLTIPYVVRVYTHYYHPALTRPNHFRPSATGEVSQVEGWYTDGKGLTKFTLETTAKTTAQLNAVLADLHRKLKGKEFT